MGLVRRGIMGLTVAAGVAFTATAVAADGARTAEPAYFDRPLIWRGLYGGAHLGQAMRTTMTASLAAFSLASIGRRTKSSMAWRAIFRCREATLLIGWPRCVADWAI
jgi:hypothetical protein